MFRTFNKYSVVAMTLGASLVVASVAEAGPYAGNLCISKKQGALSKYAKAVGKAWDKNPSDMAARNFAISEAFTKLDGAWTKAETKAAGKNASCNESTATSTVVAAAVDAAATAVTGDQALTGYIAAVMKARGKYIKDALKDPGKVKLEAAIDAAETDHLTGAGSLVTDAADELESDLVELTTTAPDYPATFQSITPGGTVEYGKETLNPICVDGDPYMFFAKRGTSNNVVMYYQGGGACWSDDACFNIPLGGSICDRTVVAGDNPANTTTGFADYSNPDNPFHDWSVVFVSYCTCDVHWGDNIIDYTAGPGHVARHKGRVNAAVVEKWAREHFIDPDKVFVTGSSAGSYGAIMNSYFLMKNVWPNADYSVLGDAGVGVITKQWLDNYILNWGVDKNFPTDIGLPSTDPRDLSLVDLVDGLATSYPNARFANYDSSFDGGSGSQTQFFQAMRHPTPDGSIISDWPSFWASACDWNACMREFKEENATRATNYRLFTGAGSRHTIFGSDKVYEEAKSTTAGGTPVTFVDWVQAMVDDTPAWVDVDCNNPGGDCNLTNSCQGGANKGLACSQKCVGGVDDGNDCANNSQCDSSVCANSNADCPGGSCQLDPDSTNAPYNNDDTITCAPSTCPCGSGAGECFDGANEGLPCTTDAQCPSGTCSWVNCPTFTP